MYAYRFDMRPLPISGNGARPSLFGTSVQSSRTFHPVAAPSPNLGRHFLGQTPMEWYRRAKKALAEFDALLNRVAQIANKTVREQILKWIGTANDDETKPAAYRYNTVMSDLRDVEATTPLEQGVKQYEISRRQNRIEKLENYNRELAAMVTEAETVYGKLPEPVTIEKTRIVETTDWTLPLIVGGGAVAVAIGIALLG